MNNLTDITANFGTLYFPKSALVFYQSKGTDKESYVEHFDMDKDGNPINAHPLTVREANILARCLQTDEEKNTAFLKPKGILPTNVLHINPSNDNGTVLWYTKAQQRQLYFVDSLEIPNGKAQVPAMLWLASKSSLLYLLWQTTGDQPKKRLCITPHFSTSMKRATYVWER
ncbi:prokaryotic E2 ligase family D protein [Chryseobacterium arthrosphaerae]|uniref:prokaryotic E2 ligase family D protein n=1 Tax=Chryseobacterium arthrosphaerae TaxID=651561 RepID=UPI001F4AC240|nr:prokaryotic E2 ligase family D protein [Chryseobacterium arthrosphaerae]